MITCNQGKGIPCVMKLTHYLRYYEQRYGSRISPEMAEKEAAREGFVLDLTGTAGAQPKAIDKNAVGHKESHSRPASG
jgi:hypothetical protein